MVYQHAEQLFQHADILLIPVSKGTAFKNGQHVESPISMYEEDVFNLYASLAGLPAISVPLGEGKNGLPFGIQQVAKRFDDLKLLTFADHLYQQNIQK